MVIPIKFYRKELRRSSVKKVVKAKNLIAFRIWLEKLGYSVKNLADGKGFTFSFKKEYGLSLIHI